MWQKVNAGSSILSINKLVYLQCSHKGWWYVNLKGLEGYVPGAYWEAYHSTSSPRSSPPTRRRPPQPVPRNRSPPNTATTPDKPASIDDEAWYHGKMSRPESEKLLSNFSNGVFLIRESVNRVCQVSYFFPDKYTCTKK